MRRSTPATRAARSSTETDRSSASFPVSSTPRARTCSSASGLQFRSMSRAARQACRSPSLDRQEVHPVHEPAVSEPTAPIERLLYEVKKVIVGQDHLLERLAVALLARGHLLVEGVPGLA